MRPAYQVNVVLLVKSRHDLLTEGKGDTSVVLAPTLHVLVGVRPEEVAEEAGVRDVGRSHNPLDLLERAQLWAQSTVHTEDLLIYNSCDREAVETVSESFPQLNIVPTLALIIKTIDSVD